MARGQGVGHHVGGAPQFDGWPRWNSYTHQQVYVDWVHRAVQGGLRLMVMHAVNNGILCQASYQRAGFGCDDMAAVDRQIAAARALEQYVDNQYGGPGRGWYRIVTSPKQAREVMSAGKLAVVLGIEVDNIFGCKSGGCSEADLRAGIEKYYNLGVRHLFPVHLMDNGLAGAALFETAFDYTNFIMNGSFFDVRDCAAEGVQFRLGVANDLTNFLKTVFVVGTEPTWPYTGQCNARGLTPLGEKFVKLLMSRHMVIDIDHMSRNAENRTLEIAENVPGKYPIVASHTGFIDMNIGAKRSEPQKSIEKIQQIYRNGGLIGAITHQGTVDEVTTFAPGQVVRDCSNSTKTWAQMYLYAVKQAGVPALAFGTDFNGFAGEPGPRFGSQPCGQDGKGAPQQPSTMVQYPFVSPVTNSVLGRSVVGQKTFDYNVDGLAHMGMLPDFIEDMRKIGVSDNDLRPLFNSAERYVSMWEKIESLAPFPPIVNATQTPAPDSGGITRGDAHVSLRSSENSEGGWPTATITYSVSGAETIPSTTVRNNAVFITIRAEGTSTITYFATDTAGNSSAVRSYSVTVNKSAVSGLSFSPGSAKGGQTITGTVTLAAPADPAGLSVVLTNSNPAAAAVQAHVRVAGGASSATFKVGIHAVASSTRVEVTASSGGVTVSGAFTVLPPTVQSLTFEAPSVPGGCYQTGGKVTLDSPAPAAGVWVPISTGNAVASVAGGGATIPGGANSANFLINSSAVTTAQTVPFTASFAGSTASASLQVGLVTIRYFSAAATTTGPLGSTTIAPGTSTSATVSMSCAAPYPITVSLASNAPTIARPSATTLSIPVGGKSASFRITASSTAPGWGEEAIISASANGVTLTKTVTVQAIESSLE
jgi:microsomal dipeptidase-like Zn-dependent dipeptidase